MENNESQALTFRQKIENYWYHYKFHTIAAVFLIFVIIWGAVSAIGRNSHDVVIGYVGEHLYTQAEAEEACRRMSASLDLDLDKNGKCEIVLAQYQHYTDEQIEERAAKAAAKGQEFAYYPEVNRQNYVNFESELASGNTAVWMVSKEVYEKMDKSTLLPIKDVLGYTPERGVVDEYAIDCMHLPLCCESVMTLSTNAYLIIRGEREYSFIMGNDKMSAELENSKALYRAIVEYKK